MKVSIFGLGYVGTVTTACLAKAGHNVMGVDVNALKVELVNSGRSPVVEEGVNQMLRDGIRAGLVHATTDGATAVRESDVSLVCVGTPSRENGSLETDHIRRTVETIGKGLAERDGYHVVILRSTSLPGTAQDLVSQLEEESGRIAGEDFGVCVNPEFLREGTAVQDFYDPPFTIIGELDDRAGDVAEAIYADLSAPTFRVGLGTGEMVKYACNAFHAMKISFANEIATICKAESVDGAQVMDLVSRDTKLNISPAYLRPGFAFGGSCLPKDLRAINHRASRLDQCTPVLNSILRSNEAQLERGIQMILRQDQNRKIAIMGLAFKGGTDDLRESAMLQVTETLIGKGRHLRIFDEAVHLGRLVGANKAYLENKIPHVSSLMVERAEDAVAFGEIIIVGNNSPAVQRLPDLLPTDSKRTIIDLIGLFGERAFPKHEYLSLT